MLIRTMTPTWVAVDEITEDSDCQGLLYAAWCGVFLLATAHARNYEEFMQRPVYRPLIDSGVFSNLIVMHGDKSWTVERMHK